MHLLWSVATVQFLNTHSLSNLMNFFPAYILFYLHTNSTIVLIVVVYLLMSTQLSCAVSSPSFDCLNGRCILSRIFLRSYQVSIITEMFFHNMIFIVILPCYQGFRLLGKLVNFKGSRQYFKCTIKF